METKRKSIEEQINEQLGEQIEKVALDLIKQKYRATEAMVERDDYHEEYTLNFIVGGAEVEIKLTRIGRGV